MAAEVQVKTESVVRRGKALVLLRINLLPRGGGNRARALRLAKQVREYDLLAPHVVSIRVGSSSLLIYLRPSTQLLLDMAALELRKRNDQDVPGQLPLFARTA